jgi:hypothetical protein
MPAFSGFGPHLPQGDSTHYEVVRLRLVAAAVVMAIAVALIGAAAPAKMLEPGKLIILSTTDVKGKNEPCG